MKRTQVLKYKGKTVFYMDFSGLTSSEEVIDLIHESISFIRVQKEKSILTLANVERMTVTNEVLKAFSDFISGNRYYVTASAVVGLKGLQRMLYNGLMLLTGRDIRTFENIEFAKEWLYAFKLVEEEFYVY